MPKSKITKEQCEATFNEMKELLQDGDSYHMQESNEQYMIARVDGKKFQMVYKPLGPSSFIHCCEFGKSLLASTIVEETSDEEEEEDKEKTEQEEIEAEEEDEDDEDEDEDEEEEAPPAKRSATAR